jgi:hypothetical protein
MQMDEHAATAGAPQQEGARALAPAAVIGAEQGDGLDLSANRR